MKCGNDNVEIMMWKLRWRIKHGNEHAALQIEVLIFDSLNERNGNMQDSTANKRTYSASAIIRAAPRPSTGHSLIPEAVSV
jgi:hypothetical protein